MSAIVADGDFGIELCKILGYDPKKVRNIVITCKADSAVMVHVLGYVQEEEAEKIINLLGKYHLEEDDKSKEETGPDSNG